MKTSPRCMTADSTSQYPLPRWRGLILLIVLTVGGLLVAGFAVWPPSPTELNEASQRELGEFVARWKAGDVVVLVRHAERCDRSSHTCLGPADGITQAGRDEAVQVGARFVGLGMGAADVLSSPLTRTAQTAQAMFPYASREQDWLMNCEVDMAKDIKAHKVGGRNLLLVTHSGCIGQFEAQMGFAHASTAEYTSALIVTLGSEGKLKVLGVINPRDWGAIAPGPCRATALGCNPVP